VLQSLSLAVWTRACKAGFLNHPVIGQVKRKNIVGIEIHSLMIACKLRNAQRVVNVLDLTSISRDDDEVLSCLETYHYAQVVLVDSKDYLQYFTFAVI
jgi:hypothetical protein